MNKTRQFWALWKFQAASNPYVLFMALAFGMPFFIPFIFRSRSDFLPHLDYLLSDQDMLVVGLGLCAFMVLAPDAMGARASNAIGATGIEFLLTRAVDRYLVFRARSFFFYLLILT